MNHLDESKQATDRAREIAVQIGDKEGEARTLDSLALLAEARHNRSQALEYFQKSVNLNEQIGCRTIFAKDAQRDLDRLNRNARAPRKSAAAEP